jgi:seryl-tRNA synthetase
MDLKVLLHNPEIVKKSQFARTGKENTDVDYIMASYDEYKKILFVVEQKRKLRNMIGKEMALKRKNETKEETIISNSSKKSYMEALEKNEDIDITKLSLNELLVLSQDITNFISKSEDQCKHIKQDIDEKLKHFGNIIHDSVPISLDEENNVVVRTIGSCLPKEGLMHPDIMAKLGMDTTEFVSRIAGNRAYYLKGDMFLLQQALIQYSLQFLVKKGYEPIYTPFFMRRSAMDKVCQLTEYDESLYNLKANEETKDIDKEYLIATSEQPIAAYYCNKNLDKKSLPIKHAGFSTCFRKEAGSSGKDTLGIFRVHQFEKIEQFCIATNEGDESWKMMEEMLQNSEEFYQSLGIEYRIINIVSGALNNAAAKKYDLEAWFPVSKCFKELVSCSNCTDYQSRNVECIIGLVDKTGYEKVKNYAHMLNATLCAVTRTMCCICETHQNENGVKVPAVLIPFVGKDFLHINQK